MSAIFIVRQDSDLQSETETETAARQLWKVFELPHSITDDLSLASLRSNLENMEHLHLMESDIPLDFMHDGLDVKTYMSMPLMERYEEVHDVVIEALKEKNLELAREEKEAINKELTQMMQVSNTTQARPRPQSPRTKTSSKPSEEFHFFSELPKELRLMIWRYSLPEPRIITCRHQLGIPLGGPKYIYLYPSGPFHAQNRQAQNSSRGLSPNHPNPVTLSICHESRTETLRHYTPATHQHVPSRVTYFSPARDVLHLEFGDLYSDAVFAAYGAQLDNFKAILLHMWQWCAPFPGAYYIHTSPTHPTRFIAKLRGLREVLLRPRFAEPGSGHDPPSIEVLQREAEDIREEYWKERVLHGDWTVDLVRVVDQDGEVY